MPTLTVKIYDGGGDPRVGDTFALSGGPGDTEWNPKTLTGYAGRFVKGANESNVFFAFDVSGIPLGSLITRGGFAFWTSIAGTGQVAADRIGIGFVLPDGTWEVNGFARAQDVTSGPFYEFAYKFPNDGTALPHSAADNSAAIQPGILLNDAYLFQATTGPTNFPAETQRSFGDGGVGPDFPFSFALPFNEYRNWLGHDKVAITLASLNCTSANRRVNLYFSEVADDPKEPFFVMEWFPNPPVFTSVAPVGTEIEPGELFTYDADADPYSLGDQTNGNFLDVTYSLAVAPAGMTIDPNTGLVSWIPTLEQQSQFYTVTVRAANAGDVFEDQSFQVGVLTLGHYLGEIQAGASLSGPIQIGSTLAGEIEGGPSAKTPATIYSTEPIHGGPVLEGEVDGGPTIKAPRGVRAN